MDEYLTIMSILAGMGMIYWFMLVLAVAITGHW